MNSNTKAILGIVLMALCLALGAYVGVWLCFIGGIVDVITEIRADDLVAMNIAIGVAKVFLAGIAGWLSAAVLLVPGYAMIQSA